MKRKVLMFADDYPPRGWSGVQRTVKFVRYMPECGWDPIVVAPSDWYSPVPLDYSFSEEVAHAVTIRTRAFTREDWSRLAHVLWRGLKPVLAPLGRDEEWLVHGLRWRLESLFFPDAGVTWLPYAVKAGLGAVRRYRPEMIYATAPPYSTLISAWIVAKMSEVPLVVDLRDLWIDNPLRLIRGRFKKRIDNFLERVVLSGSSAIVTTTQSGAKLLTKKYPKKRNKVFTVYNGYDEKDFSGHAESKKVGGAQRKLVISHVGSLYGDRSPAPFLKGLATFLENEFPRHVAISVRFIGQVSQFMDVFEAYKHLGVVELKETVDHPMAIEMMKNSDVLLLIQPEKHKKVIPGKVFEYLASRRPILGIVPRDGEVAELLRKVGNAWVVDVRDEEEICQCLNEIYEIWRPWQIVGKTDQEYVRKFERKSLTAQLCKIFAAVAGDRPYPSQVP